MAEETGTPFWRLYWLDGTLPVRHEAFTAYEPAVLRLESLASDPMVRQVWLEECRVIRRVVREPKP